MNWSNSEKKKLSEEFSQQNNSEKIIRNILAKNFWKKIPRPHYKRTPEELYRNREEFPVEILRVTSDRYSPDEFTVELLEEFLVKLLEKFTLVLLGEIPSGNVDRIPVVFFEKVLLKLLMPYAT